jgi:hypothetical protein
VLRLLAQGCRPQEIALMRGVLVRRIYWVGNKLRNRFGAETNEHLIARAAEEGFLPRSPSPISPILISAGRHILLSTFRT